MAESITRALVLDIKKHEENEFIVTFFNQKGVFSLFAKGLEKPTSKNKSNLILGGIVDIEYFAARSKEKVGRLKKATLETALDITNRSNSTLFIELRKLFLRIQNNNHLFLEYQRYMDDFNEKNNQYVLTYFYAQVMPHFGISPSFNKCFACGSTRNFVNFEINNGGFICNQHGQKSFLSPYVLHSIWASFHNLLSYIEITDIKLNYELQMLYKNTLQEAGIVNLKAGTL
ncbi:DNA repair protein RecO [Mycoplasma sp. Pen4]|uniref:DNA repair protein RecO n=1 Tax=Mycoplasma sp. Pen4 TaxID=640330 RepID=UPI0016543C3D|nr:DNA repair protein RecO [Mycoplasma sp. Pen4]QNM93926.1 DNA repair protein RecO [Mycoplasma sp. Pen4]